MAATPTKHYWLMKSEPFVYSIADLARDQMGLWDGVRNYQVRNMMRDQMQSGDKALFYHSNAKEIGCVGVMEITGPAVPDPLQFDPKSEYYDAKSTRENPRWLAVPVRYQETFARVVTLGELKNDPDFATLPVVQKGNRLSVVPVGATHFKKIVRLGQGR